MLSAIGLSATLEQLSTARRFPEPLVRTALAPYAQTGYLGKHGLDARRLAKTLSLPVDPLAIPLGNLPPIDVVIPCGPGDFEVLPAVIEAVPNGTSNPIRRIQIVTPPTLTRTLKTAVDPSVELVDENDLLGAAIVTSIGDRFPRRRNWVLQQLVKVASVIASDADGVLILDADTILLRPRTWLTLDDRQVLTPTIEWHQPYYDFLSRLSQGQWQAPEYSFVPHHMLMQPGKLGLILEGLRINGVEGLFSALGEESDYSTGSMFCIEYELYAQGLLHHSPNSAVLAKWSNRNVSRERQLSTRDTWRYMSVSRHHYLS